MSLDYSILTARRAANERIAAEREAAKDAKQEERNRKFLERQEANMAALLECVKNPPQTGSNVFRSHRCISHGSISEANIERFVENGFRVNEISNDKSESVEIKFPNLNFYNR